MSGDVSPLAYIPLITRNMTLPNLGKFSYLLIDNIFKFLASYNPRNMQFAWFIIDLSVGLNLTYLILNVRGTQECNQ